jgi:biotin carboxyl carrier protein
MKMEHTIAAPHAGRVAEVRVEPGEQVDSGRVLVVLEEPQ